MDATATATRTTRNGKAVIHVTFPDGTTQTVGGSRAERATVAIVNVSTRRGKDAWRVFGVRANAAAGQHEADKMHDGYTMRVQNHRFEIPANPTAHAVTITDA